MKYRKSHTRIRKSIISRAIYGREFGVFTYWGNAPILMLDEDDLFSLDDLCDTTHYAGKVISFLWAGKKYPNADAPTENDIFYINLKNRRVYTNYTLVPKAADDIVRKMNEELTK